MARAFQFSTQSGRSLPNARLALDRARLLDPISAVLTAGGSPVPPGTRGHVWAFSPKSLLATLMAELLRPR